MIALNNFEETSFSTFVRENDAVNDGFLKSKSGSSILILEWEFKNRKITVIEEHWGKTSEEHKKRQTGSLEKEKYIIGNCREKERRIHYIGIRVGTTKKFEATRERKRKWEIFLFVKKKKNHCSVENRLWDHADSFDLLDGKHFKKLLSIKRIMFLL